MRSLVSISILVLFFTVGFNYLTFAQSDKEIVDKFKSGYVTVEKNIKAATTLQELEEVAAQINSLSREFSQHKDLLDKSLYPDKYDASINKLNNEFLLRKGDFTTIDVLQTEVGELKQEVEFLNQRNNELIAQVQNLEARGQKDAKSIKKLENLVAELRSSIRQRDDLVLSMIDSLMPPIVRDKDTLTIEDKTTVATQEQKNNVLNNIKITIRDNIQFIQVTSLKPDDLSAIKKQQADFSGKWSKVGTKLVEVYIDHKSKADELKQIEELFDSWYAAVSSEAWESMNEEFSLNGIELRSFKNGKDFTSSVEMFITEELKNLGVKSEQDSKKVYANFADSTWFEVIQPVWMNYLVENKLLTDENKNKMESKIAEWKNALYPSHLWIYLIAAVLIIVMVVFFFIRRRKQELPSVD